MRRVGARRTLLSLSILLIGVGDAYAAREQMSMPYACAVAGGRLLVEPSERRTYAVVGPHQQQPFTFCAGQEPGHCRTWSIHSFSITCGATTVPWIDVVAAAARRGHDRVRVDNGRLTVELGPRRGPAARQLCDELRSETNDRRLGGPGQFDASQCESEFAQRGPSPAVLPAGFAPIALMSARISVTGEAPVTKAPAAPTPQREVSAALDGPIGVAETPTAPDTGWLPPRPVPAAAAPPAPPAAPVAAESEPLPTPAPASNAADPPPRLVQIAALPAQSLALPTTTQPDRARPDLAAPASEPRTALASWVTVVQSVARDNSVRHAWLVGGALLSFSFVLMLGWLALRTARVAPSPAAPAQVPVGKPPREALDASMMEMLRRTAEGELASIRGAVLSLTAAPPLRSALTNAAQVLERRYLAVVAAPPDSFETWRRSRLRLERVVHDLRRLNEISEGAKRSFSGARTAREPPTNKLEAYEALGVNPGVSDRILKKVVDALRQSWHPDLAKDEGDRVLREERIKEINVAWELISGKRGAG